MSVLLAIAILGAWIAGFIVGFAYCRFALRRKIARVVATQKEIEAKHDRLAELMTQTDARDQETRQRIQRVEQSQRALDVLVRQLEGEDSEPEHEVH